MNFDEYQKQAMSFRLPTATTMYALLNLSGEVGELHSLLAKRIRDGRPVDIKALMCKELGDILWSLAAIADDYGYTLEDIAQVNIDKLTKRKAAGTIQGNGDIRE